MQDPAWEKGQETQQEGIMGCCSSGDSRSKKDERARGDQPLGCSHPGRHPRRPLQAPLPAPSGLTPRGLSFHPHPGSF